MLSQGPARTTRLRLVSRLLVFMAALYSFCWISGFPRQYDDDELPPDAQKAKSSTSSIPYPVENDKLVVTIRTTASDAYAKLPPLLLLIGQEYHDQLLLVGDLHMDIGPFHVHDVLDRLDGQFIADNPDLGRYKQQIANARAGADMASVNAHLTQEEREAMAKLDKYKMMRMLERTWELRPDRKWYVFVDTETYLFRANVMACLGQFDSSDATFFANPSDPDAVDPYATSGNTFILSGEAMQALFVDRTTEIAVWDSRATGYRSDFDVLNSALGTEIDLSINGTWPGMSGFQPFTVPYGPGFWCEQVLFMHSVSTAMASDIWRLERDRQDNQHTQDPLLFADLWTRFLQPENLETPRDDWDNLSSGPDNSRWNILFEGVEPDPRRHHQRNEEGRATKGEESWEACQESCNRNERCVQWSYSSIATPNFNENGQTKCHVSRSMRFGASKPKADVPLENGTKAKQTWKSGWRKDNFENWARQQRCKGQQN
ncbi:glycosyltransferase family 31 protein [Pleomassaria siparia CBS 279.74]|uniref:Glycosyltransferase family 31 protein n=1 Tax=Pleomassaria siparia CBS 279.74 TaxID=1314801 RepID=A0A6G1K9I6_9PLEO|nr:glycosyltransferase family 31 protein [Pleomassaria siparia CBS 279.74]